MSRGLRQLAAGIWLGLAASGSARGEGAGVGLEMGTCPDVPAAQVRRILSLELGEPVIAATVPPGTQDAGRLAVRCEGTAARLELVRGEQRITRQVEMGKVPRAGRARLLALALAELWATPPPPRATPPPEPPPPAPALSSSAPPPPVAPSHWRATALGSARVLIRRPQRPLGGGLAIEGSITSWSGWRADLLLETDVTPVSLGSVRTWLTSGSVAARLRQPLGPVELGAGLGMRFGWARMVGVPDDPERVQGGATSGVWAGPLLEAGAALSPAPGVTALVGAGYGVVTASLGGQVDGAREIAVDGFWIAGRLGIGITW